MEQVSDRSELHGRVRFTLTRLSRSGELPSLPNVATAALAVARDPMAEVDPLCRIIQTDVGIAARVLRVANSSMYGQRRPAKTLNQAVTTIGFRAMCDILMGASLRSLFDTKSAVAARLWDHALATALAAEEIVRVSGALQGGSCFLAGLLHDIGRVVFLFTDPAPMDAITGLVADGEGEAVELEAEWYGFDHAGASATLAEEWGVAAETADAVRWHHSPDCVTVGRVAAEILHTADRVAHAIGLGAGPAAPAALPTPALSLSAEDEVQLRSRTQELFASQRALFQ